MTPGAIACPICASAMRVTVTTNRNGKHAVGIHCPEDGRHFRGFINHRPYVETVIGEALAEAGARNSGTGPGGDLQNGSGGTEGVPAASAPGGGPKP